MANHLKKNKPQRVVASATDRKLPMNQNPWQTKSNQIISKPEQAMDDFLNSINLWRKPVAKDGSCLFRVVAEEVYNSQSVHLDVRKECLIYMKDNSEMFSALVEEPFDHYLHKMRNPKEWAGEVELTALSKLYDVDFLVYQNANEEPMHLPNGVGSKKIRLCYLNGNHYDAIYPKHYKETATLVQGIIDDLIDESIVKSKDNNQQHDHCMMKRVNSNEYRNVELEVFDESKKDQQTTDEKLAAKFELQVNDECSVILRDSNYNDGLQRKAFIKFIVSQGELYEVFVEELEASFHVPFEDIDLPLDTTYRELSGYYRKADLQENSYKTQSNRRKKNNRGRNNASRGRSDQVSDQRKEGRGNSTNDRSNQRNRKCEPRRNQPLSNGQPPVKSETLAIGAKSDTTANTNPNINKMVANNATNETPQPVSVPRGPEKEANETSSAFWGKLKFTTPKPTAQPKEDKKLDNTTTQKCDATISSDADISSDINSQSVDKSIQEIKSNKNQGQHSNNNTNISGNNSINKAENILNIEHAPSTRVAEDDQQISYSNDNDTTVSDTRIENSNIPHNGNIPTQSNHVEEFVNEVSNIVSLEEQPPQQINIAKGNKKNKNKIQILKKDQEKPESNLEENRGSGETGSSQKCSDNLEKREKKVSFAANVTEITEPIKVVDEIPDNSIPALVNGINDNEDEIVAIENDNATSHLKPISNDSTQATPTLNHITPGNQQLPGVFIPNYGFVCCSVDPEGKDLPTDPRITQHFFNYGIQRYIYDQQQQQQQQHQQIQQQHNPHLQQQQHLHIPNRYVNTLPSSAMQAMPHNSFGYPTTDDISRNYQPNTYPGQTMNEMYDYTPQYLVQPQAMSDYAVPWKHANEYRGGNYRKKLYGKNV